MQAASPDLDPDLDIVSVDASQGGNVSLVAAVRTTSETPIPAGRFSVAAGDARLHTRVVPVIPEQAALGLVVDASAAGALTLQKGLSGSANLILQLPPASRVAVVADTSPPAVLAPAASGAVDALRALSGVRPQGERATQQALSLAVRQLPAIPGGRRVIVLYTDAPDAGGVSAADLARQLVAADTLLAVVSARADTAYWSQAATATGGVLATARPSAVMGAFDDVASALHNRYVLTFPSPKDLPAQVSVRVTTGDATQTAQVLVSPAQVGSPEPPGPVSGKGGGMSTLLWVLVPGAVALLIIVGAMVFALRRSRSSDRLGAPAMADQGLDTVPGDSMVPQVPTGADTAATSTDAEVAATGRTDTLGPRMQPARPQPARPQPAPTPPVLPQPGAMGLGREPGRPELPRPEPARPEPAAFGPAAPNAAVPAPRTSDIPENVTQAPPSAASPSAEAQDVPATSAAAAIAAAERRARAVAAATRAASEKTATRRGGQPSGEPPGGEAAEDRRGEETNRRGE